MSVFFLAVPVQTNFGASNWIIAALIGPAVVIPWSLTLLIFWFHPVHGRFYSGRIWVRLPQIIQVGVRAFAAVFLVLFFTFGMIGWPVLVMKT